MPKLTITIEVDLVDLSDEDRAENAKHSDCSVDELPNANDVCPVELGDMIADHLGYSNDEIWAGSGCYARIENVRCVSASSEERRDD